MAGPAAPSKKSSFTKDLDKEVINSMHKTLLGGERDLPAPWAAQGLTFRESGMRCGILQHEGGPCGVLAAVQAFVVRQLLLEGTPLAGLTREAAGEALVAALSHIIWTARMGRLANVVVCKRATLPALREAAGELVCTECKSLDDVIANVRAGIGAFVRPKGPGVAMLLYSLLLTRGIAMVQRDADFPATIIAPNGYCSQELVNLLLIGRAHSNVFDGEQMVGEADEDGTGGCRLRGIPRRSPVGFLSLFERQGEPGSLLQVGGFLKRPAAAVFVLQSESHYSVLWAPAAAPDLELPREDDAPADGMEGYGDDAFEADDDDANRAGPGAGLGGADDGSAEAFRAEGGAPFDGDFDLLYFDQMAESDEPVRLTLRRRPGDAPLPDYHLVPPLENVLLTRWPAAALDWNGHEVIL